MDTCTRHRVNYFAINVRFVAEDDVVVTKKLAVKDTEAQHTSSFMQQLVTDVLLDFDIKKSNVLSIITDNASNMISLVKLMNKKEIPETDLSCDDVEEAGTSSTIHLEENLDEEKVDDHDIEGFEESPNHFIEFTEAAASLTSIEHQRCCAHTLQLAIRDALQEKQTNNLLLKARKAVTSSRAPKLDSILKRSAKKGAIIDQVTRWGSTYCMIHRLIELKPFLVDMTNPDVNLTQQQWEQLENLENLLMFSYEVTKILQEEDLTLGKFFNYWKKLEYHISKKTSSCAVRMLDSMKQRSVQLLSNKLLLARVYIDPANRVLLNETQRSDGKAAVIDIAIRVEGLRLTTKSLEEDRAAATDSDGTWDEDED